MMPLVRPAGKDFKNLTDSSNISFTVCYLAYVDTKGNSFLRCIVS